jgi:2-keto-4-pentenoate hydratase/2-oxohepta-3-ene-1,7-dioic acid hydratase in catechol pathway
MNALAHAMGADLTAREKQRDHKQFYLGKSPDTFCPMVFMTPMDDMIF